MPCIGRPSQDELRIAQVLTALTRKFDMTDDVDLGALSTGIPPQCTGADLYGMCADAWLQALRRRIAELTESGRVSATSDEVHDLDDVDIEARRPTSQTPRTQHRPRPRLHPTGPTRSSGTRYSGVSCLSFYGHRMRSNQ